MKNACGMCALSEEGSPMEMLRVALCGPAWDVSFLFLSLVLGEGSSLHSGEGVSCVLINQCIIAESQELGLLSDSSSFLPSGEQLKCGGLFQEYFCLLGIVEIMT